jgi:hypothetical protein
MVSNTFGNRYLMQPMRRLNVHFFFSFGFLGVGGVDFFSFLVYCKCVPIMFPRDSNQVP